MLNEIYEIRTLAALNELAPNTKRAALAWYGDVKQANIEILVYDTMRTPQEQAQNIANGVSWTTHSYHLVGQALDWVLIDPITKKGLWRDSDYNSPIATKVIELAKKRGFQSGRDWQKTPDAPHLQYTYKGYGTDKVLEGSNPVQIPSGTYRNGDSGNDVKLIQTALKINSDGIFGPKTEQAVIDFQKKNNLVADGIVGQKTIAALFK